MQMCHCYSNAILHVHTMGEFHKSIVSSTSITIVPSNLNTLGMDVSSLFKFQSDSIYLILWSEQHFYHECR